MKKPSIDAIRRFKEQQEQKKLQEAQKRIQEKLSTLEHRAAQGDRKAKHELKIIEKAKEERSKQPEINDKNSHGSRTTDKSNRDGDGKHKAINQGRGGKKPKGAITDFDELMKLAASNNNQLRREEPKLPSQSQRVPSIAKKSRVETVIPERPETKILPTQQRKTPTLPSTSRSITVSAPAPRIDQKKQILPKSRDPSSQDNRNYTIKSQNVRPQMRHNQTRPSHPRQIIPSHARDYRIRDDYYDDEDDDEYDDEYEQDDFVVEEEDVETQNEVSKTIRNVFGYDKRRCDLREAELDRQYRQIGKVSTFEDLEREERRASRLAAVEDAKAQREEEERKRLKKMRLKGHR